MNTLHTIMMCTLLALPCTTHTTKHEQQEQESSCFESVVSFFARQSPPPMVNDNNIATDIKNHTFSGSLELIYRAMHVAIANNSSDNIRTFNDYLAEQDSRMDPGVTQLFREYLESLETNATEAEKFRAEHLLTLNQNLEISPPNSRK